MQADPGNNKRYCFPQLVNEVPATLDEEIYKKIENSIGKENNIVTDFEIKNTHRAVGTRLSHYIYKKINEKKIQKDSIIVNLSGSAGQSLGAFGIKGLKLNLTGEANDYVGKGLSGATVVVKPPKESGLISN